MAVIFAVRVVVIVVVGRVSYLEVESRKDRERERLVAVVTGTVAGERIISVETGRELQTVDRARDST